MIKENQAEFDKSNLSTWHNAGYKGKGIHIVILDDTSKVHKLASIEEPFNDSMDRVDHKTGVGSTLREVFPEGHISAFSWFGSDKDNIINWIVNPTNNVHFVNCSFNSNFTSLEGYMKRIYDAGITIIASSGNNYDDDTIVKPSRFPTTIAVGAWEELRDRKADYSNGGKELDIVAYSDIYIPTSDGYSRLMKFSGTSCAAPVTSGMLGCYLGWRLEKGLPLFTPEESKKFVQTNTRDVMELGFDYLSGYGLFTLPNEIPEVKGVIEVPIIEEPIIPKEIELMTFKDIDTHWAKEYIDYVVEKGYMKGNEDGTFEPDGNITRAEFAVVLARKDGFVPIKK